jgi:cytochrome c oxidase subunit 4
MAADPHATETQPSDPHAHVGHVVPIWLLAVVFGSLLVLTWITVEATRFDFGPELNLAIALAIAFVKGMLVCLYFMHLRWDRPINSIIFVGSIFFVTLFVFFALLDRAEYDPSIVEFRQANPDQVAPELERQGNPLETAE